MKKNYVKLKASLARTAGLLMLLMAMLAPLGAWADELTVCDGTTTSSYIPFYGYYADCNGQKSQMVFPSTELTAMNGSNINKIRFYSNPSNQNSWTATWQVYLMEVESTTINGFYDETTGTLVYEGTFSVSSSNYLDIQFATEYEYGGGNLLVCTKLITTGNCPYSSFYGITSNGSSLCQSMSGWNPSQKDFLPKTTFTYESSGPKFDITAGTFSHADGLSFSPNPASEGNTVTVTAVNLETGYEIESVTVTGATSGTNNYPGNTFTMPGEAVTVDATMTEKPKNDITINKTGGNEYCTVTASVANPVYVGTDVTLTVNEPDGYKLTSLSATYNDGEDHDLGVTTTNKSFTMPAYPVTVNAAYMQIEELIVNDGTESNENIPIYGYFCDSYQENQFIIPATQLGAMNGASITSMTFYIKTPATTQLNCNWNVKVMETSATSLANLADVTAATLVYNGYIDVTGSTFTITFATPFVFNGNNLLVDFSNTNTDTYSHCHFFGVNAATNSSICTYQGYNGTTTTNYAWLPKVKFTYPPTPGFLITKVNTNCTISAMVDDVEVAKAEEGETVDLTCTPNTHYTFNSWNVYKTGDPDTKVTVTNNAFTMPNYAVTVEAVLDEDQKYEVTYATLDHGYFSDNTQTLFYEGEEVLFSVYPNDGYILNTVTATDVEVNNYFGNYYYFNMPANNVTVNATFTEKAKNDITINKTGGNEYCTVTASVANPVYEGTDVTLTVNEPDGYKLTSLSATYNDGEDHDLGVTTTNRSFTMPAYPVTVNAIFIEVEVEEVFSEAFFKNTGDDNRPYSRDVWSEEDSGTHWGFSSSNHSPEASAFHWVNTSKMVTPELNLNLATSATVSFWVKIPEYYYYDYYNDALYIYYRTSSTDSWKSLKTYDEVIADFTEKTITLPAEALTPTCQLAFQVSVYYSNRGGVFVDDVIVSKVSPALPGHTITKVEDNCTITVLVDGDEIPKAEEGAAVTLTCTPDEHFTFNSWNVYKTGDPDTKVTVTDNAFTMPGYAVTVEAVLDEDQKYEVTYATLEQGYFSDNTQTMFYANDIVHFSVNPNSGYYVKTVTATVGEVMHDSGNHYYFTMPAEPVTVNATFGEFEQLTVYDGTGTSNKAPFYVYYADDFTKVNMIMQASDLAEMSGANISAMTFHISSGAGSNSANWQVYLKETDETQVGNPIDVETATKVYEGQIDFTGTTVTINFSTPYHYTGNNLLIATQNTNDPGYKDVYFYGNASAGTNVSGYKSDGTSLAGITTLTATNFLPKTTFTYPALPGYLITKVNTNCTISAMVDEVEVAKAEEGTTVNLAYSNLAEHYTFDGWNVYKTGDPDTKVTVTDNAFTMPGYSVTVEANLTQETQYAVTPSKVDGDGNPLGEYQGYLSVYPTISYADETITIYCDNQNHWNFQSVEILTTDDEPTGITPEGSEGIYTFTMPAYAVKVQVTFTEEATYTINVVKYGGDDNEIILTPASPAYAGENVTVTANPVAGYMLGRVVVRKDATGEEVTVTNKTFTMPAENVTVYASFYEGFEFFEDFETNPSTNGWTYASSGTGNWQWSSGGHSGNCVYCSWSAASSEPYIITPALNLAGYEDMTMTFWRKQPNYNGLCEELNVKYTLDDGANWTLIENYNTITEGYVETTIAIPAAACTDGVKFGFQAIYHDANSVYVDDVRIFKEPALPSYSITPSVTGNGELSFTPEGNVEVGTTVTITAIPTAAGNALTSLSYLREDGRAIDIDVETLPYTFTMPECNTTVTAVFESAPQCTVTLHINGLTIGSEKNAYVGCPFELTSPAVPEGHTFYGWTDADITQGTTVAPLKVAEPSATEFIPAGDSDLWAVFVREEASNVYTAPDNGFGSPESLPFEDGAYYVLYTWSSKNIALYVNENGQVCTKNISVSSDGTTVTLTENEAGMRATYINTGGHDGFTFSKGSHRLQTDSDNTCYTSTDAPSIGQSEVFDYHATDAYRILSEDGYSIYYNNGYKPNNSAYYYASMTALKSVGVVSHYYTYVADTPIAGEIVIEGDITINPAQPLIIGPTAVVTVTGTMTSSDPANIIIKDGGELILANGNTGVKATVEKEVTTTSSKDYTIENWYTIGSCVDSPYINDNTQPNHVENMIVGNYDLYYLDYTKEKPWINYRDDSGNPKYFNLVNGRGYIYANQSAQTLQYKGDINVSNMTVDVNANHWNLIANPFAQTIEFSRFDLDDGAMEGYYALDGEGAWLSSISTADVKNNQGILVHVPAEGSQITISRPENDGAKRGDARSEEYEYVEINVSNASYSDRAYATFTKGNGLPKYNHFNDKIQKVYIPQDGSNFAIACIDDNATVFPVNFKAVTTGKYSISLNATEEINYLVLVDNMTGEETDMLLEDSYTFIGSPRDDEGRFTVKLGFSDNTIESETFVYQNGNELIINGEGTLQMIDMLGRVVMSKEVYGKAVSVDNVPAGAYIIRMIGSEVKTQKIVIR